MINSSQVNLLWESDLIFLGILHQQTKHRRYERLVPLLLHGNTQLQSSQQDVSGLSYDCLTIQFLLLPILLPPSTTSKLPAHKH